MMRVQLANTIQSRDGSLDKDAKLVNFYVEGADGQTAVVSRPGILASLSPSSPGSAQGLFRWNRGGVDDFFFVAGGSIFGTPVVPAASSLTTFENFGAAVSPSKELYWFVFHNDVLYGYFGSPTNANATPEVATSTDRGETWSSLSSVSGVSSGTVSGGPFDGSVINAAPIGMVSFGGYIYAVANWDINNAGTENTSNRIYRSSDGINFTDLGAQAWTARTGAGLAVHNSKLYLMSGYVDTGELLPADDVWESATGTSFSLKTAAAGFGTGATQLSAVSHGGALFAATANSIFKSVNDGATWASVTPPAGFVSGTGQLLPGSCLASYNGNLVAYSRINNTTRQLYTSADLGTSWNLVADQTDITDNYDLIFANTPDFVLMNWFSGQLTGAAVIDGTDSATQYTINSGTITGPVQAANSSLSGASQQLMMKTNDSAWVLTDGN